MIDSKYIQQSNDILDASELWLAVSRGDLEVKDISSGVGEAFLFSIPFDDFGTDALDATAASY